MFIIDDILLSPVKGFLWIVRELHDAAQRELEAEADRLTAQLRTLHTRLELGDITEEEFDEREAEILDRLDQLAGETADGGDDDDTDEDAEDDSADDGEDDDTPEPEEDP